MRYKLRYIFLGLLLSNPGTAVADPGTVKIGLNGGLLYGNLPAGGLELDFNLGSMFSIGGALLNSSANFAGTIEDTIEDADANADYDVEEATIRRNLAMLTAKVYPFMGSFNIALAVGSGQTVATLKVSSDDTSEQINETYTYNNATAGITLGNTWRWRYFYFGFDWLGYMAMLNAKKDEESDSTSLTSESFGDAFDKYEEVSDFFGEKGGPILLMFRIGTGF